MGNMISICMDTQKGCVPDWSISDNLVSSRGPANASHNNGLLVHQALNNGRDIRDLLLPGFRQHA